MAWSILLANMKLQPHYTQVEATPENIAERMTELMGYQCDAEVYLSVYSNLIQGRTWMLWLDYGKYKNVIYERTKTNQPIWMLMSLKMSGRDSARN